MTDDLSTMKTEGGALKMSDRVWIGMFTIALGAVGAVATPAEAQNPFGLQQLHPFPEEGGIVTPFFDGWYANPDGSYTVSFGFMNRNTEELIEIPIGPDNFIEPAEFDGVQPTSFPPVSYGGFSGRRERGVFAITIPAEYRDRDIVWTLTHAGETFAIPGRIGSVAYELSHEPMGSGSLPPLLSFSPEGPFGQDRMGVASEPLTTTVGTPLTIEVWAEDQGVREDDERFPVDLTWWKHQGPGTITFEPANERLPMDGSANGEGPVRGGVAATFSEPGDYMVRVRADNFAARDSRASFQCCWTNGYVPVIVTP